MKKGLNLKQKNILIIILLALSLIMAVSYAAFSADLNINGTAAISSSWDIKIIGISPKNIKGSASNNSASYEDLSATLSASLISPGDSIDYEITIKNNGSVDAELDSITGPVSDNDAILFTKSGLYEGYTILAGETKTLTITVQYSNSVTSQPEKTTASATVSLSFKQYISKTYNMISVPSGYIEGNNTAVDGLSDASFRSDANYNNFTSVKVDNNTVDSSNYTVTSGSTIVTLKKDYVNTLSLGEHNLSIISTNGIASTTFIKTRLPKEYQEVEYLESTGSQYINTAVIAGNTISAELDFIPLEYTGGSNIGTFSNNITDWDNRDWRFFNYSGGSMFDVGSSRLGYNSSTLLTNGNRYVVSFGNTYFKINGIYQITNTSQTYNIYAAPIYVFGGYIDGNASLAKMKLMSLKMWDNNTLVRNFVPCYRKSDSKTGLYDMVNNIFYINNGTGEFALGKNV